MISMRISMEQSLKCREVGFEMAIYWYRVAEGHKLRRICSQDSYCIGFYLSCRRRKFGFNVHITINTGQLLRQRENHTQDHRRTGYFLPGGAVNHLPKKFLQVAQNSRTEIRADATT